MKYSNFTTINLLKWKLLIWKLRNRKIPKDCAKRTHKYMNLWILLSSRKFFQRDALNILQNKLSFYIWSRMQNIQGYARLAFMRKVTPIIIWYWLVNFSKLLVRRSSQTTTAVKIISYYNKSRPYMGTWTRLWFL